jgi:hypothetical protein
MPFTKFTNLDFDQIKTSIKDYLRANSNFTDFDFEGSNFSVLIDTLAYNTYITAFNSNMIVNESFLDSATVRENVVSLARNIGYVPRSRSAAAAEITFEITTLADTPTLTVQAGLLCVGESNNTSFTFAIPENITALTRIRTINGQEQRYATFGSTEVPIVVYQGSFLTKQFVVESSVDQRFVIDNPFVDSSTIRVYVKSPSESGLGREYSQVDNILGIDKNSETYLIQEVQDEKYELLFGDNIFGKKLESGAVITVNYIVTDGKSGNGAARFNFAGNVRSYNDTQIKPVGKVTVKTISPSKNGADIESVSSIKYFAPRLYSAQYRAVTTQDYETIIHQIYPYTESVSVIGGEELSPPQFGNVLISIKPKNGDYISDFDKQQILSKLKSYAVSGINQQIIDLKVLYVEIDSTIYYNSSQTSSPNNLLTDVLNALNKYSESTDLNSFGGRFKYSKVLQVIDNVNRAITSNITKVRIRRNLKVLVNQLAQYELCFGNRFHINPAGYNIKSSGFYVENQSGLVYLTDVPNKKSDGTLDGSGKGVLSVVQKQKDGTLRVIINSAGTVDYYEGEVIISTINITGTEVPNNIIEIQAYPESNDIISLKDLYLKFDVSSSTINMLKDVITSGEDTSGIKFINDYYTSSYSNGSLERK